MEWLKLLLQNQGLDSETIDKIMEAAKEQKYVPKSRLDEVIEQRDSFKEELSKRDIQITELGKKVKDNEELTQVIEGLKADNQKQKEEFENKLKEQSLNSQIREKLSDTNYAELLIPKIDKQKLVVSPDGSVYGLEEQITKLKEEYKDLFTPVVQGAPPNNKNLTPPGDKNPWSKEHFNLTEQGRLLRENPTLAAKFKMAAN